MGDLLPMSSTCLYPASRMPNSSPFIMTFQPSRRLVDIHSIGLLLRMLVKSEATRGGNGRTIVAMRMSQGLAGGSRLVERGRLCTRNVHL